MTATPIALTIAGSDSSGGAGIQADLKTFAALGVYGASVITALTAQNTRGVTAVHAVPPDVIRAQIRAIADDLAVTAIKIGMVGNTAAIEAVAEELGVFEGVPVVLDPVMVATSGDALLEPGAAEVLKARLLPHATVLTPNLREAARLLGEADAADAAAMGAQARRLERLGPKAVLVKGGHAEAGEAVDVLFDGAALHRVAAPWVATRNTHGTGCTLSSAIAAGLARGLPLLDAVHEAKQYLSGALRHADALAIGSGRGPVHHFHALWKR